MNALFRQEALVEALFALHGHYLEDPVSTREELLAAATPLIGDRWTQLLVWVAGELAARLPEPAEERAHLLLAASCGTKSAAVTRAVYRERMALAVELLTR